MTNPGPSTRWSLRTADPHAVASLASALGLSKVTAAVLVSRGLDTAEKARRFFEPSLDAEWLSPSVIPGMDEAADRVARAVSAGESIVVFGDFDLDGVSATAVATRGLAAFGARVQPFVPHRFREGYGLSAAALDRVLAEHPDLVVTVDCGISSAAEAELLRDRGVDLVVTDHHEPGDSVPLGGPVANPKLDAACPSRDLAGAGVALKLVQAVGERIGQPDRWRDFVDLATLGTIADIVPLIGENRALVTDGLSAIRRSPRAGIAALCAVAGASVESLGSDTVAFAISPRLNAAGRMADPKLALDLLLADDPVRAEQLARTLDEHNRTRQSVEADLAQAALALASRIYHGERALVLAGEGWHEGVKGIVASRVAQAYGVPALLFSIEDGVARGSGRSVGSVDLFGAVSATADLLDRFGGHEAAVGLALPADKLDAFRDALLAHLDTLPAEQFEVACDLDAEITLEDASVELGAELALLEPFGAANPRPMLVARDVFMNGRERVGKTGTHLRFTAYDGVGSVGAIAFRCPDIDEIVQHDAAVDLAFSLEVDEWRGRRRVQLVVRDIARHDAADEAPGNALVAELFERADEILAREEYAGIEDAPSFHTKLAGVTFEGRQDVLARLAPGTPLRLERQPDNQYDANAIALHDPHGDQVGFFNRRLAAVLARVIDSGVAYDVEVSEVTGGADSRSFGVNVVVSQREAVGAEVDAEQLRVERRVELGAMPAEQRDRELVSYFIGDRELHAAQVEALEALAAGRSTLAVMATGRGKSLIFHLHAARTALSGGGASVFVYPLRALVADQAFHLAEAFSAVGLSMRVVTGETAPGERDVAFAALEAGELDVVLTTPEFLHFHVGRFAACGRVRFVVVDEAHHVGLARASHRPAYARLGDALEALGGPVALAVTATASDEVAAQIRETLRIDAVVLDPTVRDNLAVEDRRAGAEKDAYLAALAAKGEKVIVYVNSRDASVRLARMLRKRVPDIAWKTAFYNGGLSRSVRHAVERAFREGEVQVVVATSAFGEGVNIPDVRHVVLYHLPFNAVEFNQMSGRAGRDGAMSRVHLLFGEKDARINETILSSLAPERDDMVSLYRALRQIAEKEGAGFEITNAELAERCSGLRKESRLDDKGVSASLGVFRDLGLVTSEGYGAYRRITLVADAPKVELTSSVRYAEGLDEIEQFQQFREWVLSAPAAELLARFNRPILPTHL